MIHIWSDEHSEYEARMQAMSLSAMLWMNMDIGLKLVD